MTHVLDEQPSSCNGSRGRWKASLSATTFGLATITLVSIAAFPVAGQGAHPIVAGRVPVTIVLVENLPVTNGAAIILRRVSAIPRDVILLDPNKIQEYTLEEAVLVLMAARAIGGDTVATDARLRSARPDPGKRKYWSAREHARAVKIIHKLRTAHPVDVQGVGRVPGMVIFLPKTGLKGKLKSG